MNETTSIGEIAESYRAIKVAATERHSALRAEMRELEQMFPGIGSGERPHGILDGRGRSPRSAEAREKASAAMRAAWARRRAPEAEQAQQYATA